MTSDQIRDMSDQVGPLRPLTAAEKDAARHHAADHARDAAELAMFLDEMGLS